MHNQQVALKLFEGMNGQNLDALAALCDENIVFHFPKTSPMEGRRRVLMFLKILFRKFPVLHFETGRVVADDCFAAVEWQNRGRDRKEVPYENAGVTFMEIRDGKIVYMSDTFKDTGLF